MTFEIRPASDEEQNLETQVAELRRVRQQRLNFTVLGTGYVRYIDHLGDDQAIVEAARMSTQKGFLGWDPGPCPVCKGNGSVPASEQGLVQFGHVPCTACEGKGTHAGDASMLEFMWKNHHASPFEQAELVIEVKAPIMVFREWHRHRTQMYSEMSARYVQMPNDHYIPGPERIQKQSKHNKQGSGEALPLNEALAYAAHLGEQQEAIYEMYGDLLRHGVAKEVARVNTPVSRMSVMRAKASVRNWLGFLLLRRPETAQWEIRQCADVVSLIVNEFFPRTHQLFEEHSLFGASISRTEISVLKEIADLHSTLVLGKLGEKKGKALLAKLGLKL